MKRSDLQSFFESRFRQFGNSPRTLDWSERGQRVRFEVLYGIGAYEGKSVLDIGSGLGHFYGFLRERVASFQYRGYDIVPKLVEAARESFSDATFEVRDVLREGIEGRYDFVVSSGVHNLETGNNEDEMRSLVSGAWNAATEGIGINMLSRWSGKVETDRHFYDPIAILRYARRLTPLVVLRHDYLHHDFTIFLYREGPRTGPRPGS